MLMIRILEGRKPYLKKKSSFIYGVQTIDILQKKILAVRKGIIMMLEIVIGTP